MPINMSVVKHIAVQCGAAELFDGTTAIMTNSQLLAFANALYAMGAQEQKEKDAKICEDIGNDKLADIECPNSFDCADAIRKG